MNFPANGGSLEMRLRLLRQLKILRFSILIDGVWVTELRLRSTLELRIRNSLAAKSK